jgi:hypothetical protein
MRVKIYFSSDHFLVIPGQSFEVKNVPPPQISDRDYYMKVKISHILCTIQTHKIIIEIIHAYTFMLDV